VPQNNAAAQRIVISIGLALLLAPMPTHKYWRAKLSMALIFKK